MKTSGSNRIWIAAPLSLAMLVLTACSGETPVELSWTEQASGVTSSLRGLSVVDQSTTWVGAPDGVVLRTIDGGEHWTRMQIADAQGLDLRSAHGFDDQHALFITAGQPAQFYRTRDGGSGFDLIHEAPSPDAFFDTVRFWDEQQGLAFSDPVDAEFHILLTVDGGENWSAASDLPVPLEGEAGFAASNTMIAVADGGRAWVGTGGAETARILYTPDYGASWEVHGTPMTSDPSGAGIFSVAHQDGQLVIVGGSYTDEDNTDGAAAWSKNGGSEWFTPEATTSGYRSAVAALPGHAGHFLAVGPNGADLTRDGGRTWERISETGYHAVAFPDGGVTGWAVGSDGRIAHITISGGED
jgi:photosystem II stability/assembly factor-like uncharacterized protein